MSVILEPTLCGLKVLTTKQWVKLTDNEINQNL